MSAPGHPHDRLVDWLDGQLGEAEAAEVRQHVAGCADCRRELEWLEAGRAAARSLRRSDAAPADVRAGLMASLDAVDRDVARPQTTWTRRRMLWAGLAAAVLLTWYLVRPGQVADVDHVARAHASFQALRTDTLDLALRTTDASRLQQYFDDATSVRVRVIDLGMMGWTLEGGMVRPVGDQVGALYTYRSASANARLLCEMFRGRLADLPPAVTVRHQNGFEFRVYTRDGVTLVFWQEGDLVCVLVAALPTADVLDLAVAKAMAPL